MSRIFNGFTRNIASGNPSNLGYEGYAVAYPHELYRTHKVIDLACPIAKGSRALILAGPNTGKTTLLKSVSAAIAANNPSAMQFAMLIDERPEEVNDFEKSFPGYVASSTFDEGDQDHVDLAEQIIKACKSTVEQGVDVVLYIDSLTRLARSYSNLAPAGEKILSGGITNTALQSVKKILGAARCFENKQGSLTIIGTILEGTDSKADDAIKTELVGTSNCVIKLSSEVADAGYFPAIDITKSRSRNDELIRPRNQVFYRVLSTYRNEAVEAYKAMLQYCK